MLQGYVVLYTGYGGYKEFLDIGVCQAKAHQEEKWSYQIIVPREAVFLKEDREEDLPERFFVDIPKAKRIESERKNR